jgi:hypothetical protein
MPCPLRAAELLDRFQNATHRGKGGAADQILHGRMGLGTACKEERLKNISIESLERKKICVFTENNNNNNNSSSIKT